MSNTSIDEGKFKLPNFIKDEASSTDAFDGPHERVAKAITAVIDADPTLKVVGLLGAWGSGKSTVLRLIQNHTAKLDEKKKNKTYFFVYDAWLHQNDPPRRSFLEMLVGFLAKEKLTTKDEWSTELDRLNRQIEDTETTVTPTFTPAGRALLVSALFVPLGLEFIKYDWLHVHVLLRWVGLETTVFNLGIWMLFAPVIVTVYIYFYWRATLNPVRKQFYRWKNWTRHRSPYEYDSILSVFMKKEVERSRHRVVRSPDPTTIEFQTIFRKIMRSVMDPARKIVFVVDNLDRLPEREAVALWTTVRSFFLGVGDDSMSPNLCLPTVILPIDPGAVERMFADNHEKVDAKVLAQSFMNKTFELTFRVNPPVSSDWVSYLERQMKHVFGDDCPQDWMYSTRRLYDRYVKEKNNGVVTPREINALLNAVALLKIQWNDEVPFRTLVYFAIYRDELDNNILNYIGNAKHEPIPPDADWQRNVAAMHFGVPPDRANQVLLFQPLDTAIKDAKQEDFDKLCELPGADAVLEQVIETGEASEPEFLSNAALLIQQHKAFMEGPWLTSLWANVRKKMELAPPWQKFGLSTGAGLSAIIFSAKGNEIAVTCESVAAKLSSLDPKLSGLEQLPKEWLLAAEAVAQAADAQGYKLRNIRVPSGPKGFLSIIEAATDKPSLLSKLMPNGSGVDEVQELSGRFANAARVYGKILVRQCTGRNSFQPYGTPSYNGRAGDKRKHRPSKKAGV